MAKPNRWMKLFEEFIVDLRIASKEAVSVDDRGIRLELWESQRRFLDEIAAGLDAGVRVFFFLKSRQLGITTISLAIDVCWLAMHNNLMGALVTDDEKKRDLNRSIIVRYVNSFPEGYFGGEFTITKNNRSFIEFSNGSRLDLLVAGTKNKGTSWSEGAGYAFCHLTEVGSYGNFDGLDSLEESFAQENPNRLFIYESTAKGYNGWRARYKEAENDPFTKRASFIGWWAGDTNRIQKKDPRFEQYGTYPPDADEREKMAAVAERFGHKVTMEELAWYRWKNGDAAKSGDMLDQNQPWLPEDAFVQTGFSFFQVRLLNQNIQTIYEGDPEDYGYRGYAYDLGNDFFEVNLRQISDPAERRYVQLRVWEEPIEGARYVIGCDPAFGRTDHGDRHAIEVWRCFADKLVQVAEFATNEIEVKHCAWVLAHLAGTYRDCIVNLELGGPGRSIMHEWDHIRGLMNSEFYQPKVSDRQWEDVLGTARWYLYHRPDAMGAGYAMNFETTWRTKQEIMHGMRGSYSTNELHVRSIPLLEEMCVVVQEGAEIGAPESKSEDCKDDRVFATALAIRAWTNWTRRSMVAEGETYDRVMARERGELTPVTEGLNRIVVNFFKTAEERAQNASPTPRWRQERNL